MKRLENKIAVVVGAGQAPGETMGNGRATAIRFAQEGAKVLCVDRNLESAQETADIICKDGGEATAFAADIIKEDDCRAISEHCISVFGRLDILHNNVGIGLVRDNPLQIETKDWDQIMQINLRGTMMTCKYALPVMIEQGGGVITNISSVAADASTIGVITYKSSKAALNAYTKGLAAGFASQGIRANGIMPGLIATPCGINGTVETTGQSAEVVIAQRNSVVPLKGGMGSAWDIANASLFLASDEAKFITGAILPVDGGQLSLVGGGDVHARKK